MSEGDQPMPLNGSAESVGESVAGVAFNQCDYRPMDFLDQKLYLVVCFGTAMSLLGITCNLILLYLLTRRAVRSSHFLYFTVLAMVDIGILIMYILIYPIQVLIDWFQSLLLHRFWFTIIRPCMVILRMLQVSDTYLIVAASAERYFSTGSLFITSADFYTHRKRVATVFAIFTFAVLFKLPVFWEFIVYETGCPGLASIDIMRTSLAQNPIYQQWVTLYINRVVQLFCPFLVLLFFNLGILWKTRGRMRRLRAAVGGVHGFVSIPASFVVPRHRAKRESSKNDSEVIQASTLSIFMLVVFYLVTNAYDFTLSVLENFASNVLNQNHEFYTFSADVISLLSVFNSSMRLIIYYFCCPKIRDEFHRAFKVGSRRRRYTITSSQRSSFYANPFSDQLPDAFSYRLNGSFRDKTDASCEMSASIAATSTAAVSNHYGSMFDHSDHRQLLALNMYDLGPMSLDPLNSPDFEMIPMYLSKNAAQSIEENSDDSGCVTLVPSCHSCPADSSAKRNSW